MSGFDAVSRDALRDAYLDEMERYLLTQLVPIPSFAIYSDWPSISSIPIDWTPPGDYATITVPPGTSLNDISSISKTVDLVANKTDSGLEWSVSSAVGANCSVCNEHNEYQSAPFTCYGCRNAV